MKTNNFLVPVISGLAIIAFIAFIYYSSARFVDPPDITLPDENMTEQSKIEYINRYVYQDIVIDENNFKEVITKLTRPTTYSFTIFNTIYSGSDEKMKTSEAVVKNNEVTVVSDDVTITADENFVTFSSGEKINLYDRSLYTNDEIIGIPTYEDLLDMTETPKVTTTSDGTQDILELTYEQEDMRYIYSVSLSNGVLVAYQIYEADELVRDVALMNFFIE